MGLAVGGALCGFDVWARRFMAGFGFSGRVVLRSRCLSLALSLSGLLLAPLNPPPLTAIIMIYNFRNHGGSIASVWGPVLRPQSLVSHQHTSVP